MQLKFTTQEPHAPARVLESNDYVLQSFPDRVDVYVTDPRNPERHTLMVLSPEDHHFNICYVTSESGKTIDVLRAPESES